MPLERWWVESGRELSTVSAALHAGRSLDFLLGTGTVALTTHLPITHRLNVRKLASGACDATFKVTWCDEKTIPTASPPPCKRVVEQAEGRDS